jgi:hypothetical protein
MEENVLSFCPVQTYLLLHTSEKIWKSCQFIIFLKQKKQANCVVPNEQTQKWSINLFILMMTVSEV